MVHFKGKLPTFHFCLQVFGISHLLNINNLGKKISENTGFFSMFCALGHYSQSVHVFSSCNCAAEHFKR